MDTPKPKPPVKKQQDEAKAVKPEGHFVRKPHLTNKPFRDSEPLRKLQSDLHKNSKKA